MYEFYLTIDKVMVRTTTIFSTASREEIKTPVISLTVRAETLGELMGVVGEHLEIYKSKLPKKEDDLST